MSKRFTDVLRSELLRQAQSQSGPIFVEEQVADEWIMSGKFQVEPIEAVLDLIRQTERAEILQLIAEYGEMRRDRDVAALSPDSTTQRAAREIATILRAEFRKA